MEFFENDSAWNAMIFGVDNNPSSHAEYCKNNFLVLDEGPAFGINGSFGSTEKKFSINFGRANTKFCLSFQIIVICLLIEKKSTSWKPTIKMLTFQLTFVSEAYLMDLVLLSLEKYL